MKNYKRTSHSCWWVFVRHRRDHRQSQELHPGTIDTLQLCFIILRQLNFRLNTIPGTAVSRFEGYVNLLYNNYAARCLDFLLPILEFLRLIIQHHGVWNHGRISSLILTTSVRIIAHDSRRKSCHNFVYHRKSSLVIIHKYTASQYTSSAGGFALLEMTYTAPYSYGLFCQNFEGRSQGCVFFHNNSLLG